MSIDPIHLTGYPRYDKLISLINAHGYMRVDELAAELNVSTQTVRRDIKKLCDDGVLSRYHGGVARPSPVARASIEQREVVQSEEKRRIAGAIVERIPDRCTIFLACGTTIEFVAKALDDRNDLRIITNSLRIASLLYKRPGFDVIVPGGSIRKQNSGIVGPSAQKFFAGFRADYMVMSCGAIEADGTLLEFDINDVTVMKVMMANAKQVFLAADSSKYQASASVELGSTAQVDVFFTEVPPDPALAAVLREQKVELCCAGMENA